MHMRAHVKFSSFFIYMHPLHGRWSHDVFALLTVLALTAIAEPDLGVRTGVAS